MPCSQGSCQKDGRWRPALDLRSRKAGPATRLHFTELAVCDGHKEVATVSDFLSDEGFTKIAKFMREMGKKPPIQRNITLAFELLTPEEQAKLNPIIALAQPPEDELAF
jgi:hypothetical protein